MPRVFDRTRHTGRYRSATMAAAALACLAGTALADPPRYAATVLPQLDGADVPLTYGFGMNDAGQVTGGFGFPYAGFTWSAGSGAEYFSDTYGFSSSLGLDINNAGSVVGWYQPDGEAVRAFVGHADGTFTALPRLIDDPMIEAGATAINDNGFVVGYGATERNDGFGAPTHGVAWRDGQIIDMGDLGGFVAAATGVNNHDVAVGYANEANVQQVRAFRWTEGGGMEPLERYADGFVAMAFDINDGGSIVGAAEGIVNGEYARSAAVWGPDGSLSLLPLHFDQVPGIPSSADAYAVNELMQIVGSELDPNEFVPHAMYWENGQSFVLSDYVVDLPQGLRLDGAYDINEQGQILVQAFDAANVQFVTVLLTPVPAPGTGLLLGAGLLAATRRRR